MRFFIIIIILLFLTYIAITVYSSIEARMLCISHVFLRRSKSKKNDLSVIKKQKDAFEKNFDPATVKDSKNTKFLFFSDLHAEYCFIPVEKVIDTIKKANVDAVIFGGDICNDPLTYKKGITYLNAVKRTCDELNIPFLGVNGNHDIYLSEEQMKEALFTDLRKTTVIVKDVLISGVNDTGKFNRIWDDNPVKDTNGMTHLLVSHNPDWLIEAAERKQLDNIDHMISGHIHGGQFCFPFRIEINAIRKDKLPRRKVIDGVFDGGGITFFISRGLGCVLIPFRFLAKPEISVIEIEK